MNKFYKESDESHDRESDSSSHGNLLEFWNIIRINDCRDRKPTFGSASSYLGNYPQSITFSGFRHSFVSYLFCRVLCTVWRDGYYPLRTVWRAQGFVWFDPLFRIVWTVKLCINNSIIRLSCKLVSEMKDYISELFEM